MSLTLPTVSVTPLRIPIRNTPASLYNKGYVPPRSLMASFNWATDYGASAATPDVNVLVNVQAGGAQEPIDYIRSVKIDNTGNSFPVYVYFLDTTDTIVAPPDTIVWEPVVTNGKVANVILQGATTAGLGNTKVYFCNFFVPPYIDPAVNRVVPQYLGSPTIQRSNILTPGFGPPALGDQVINIDFSFTAGGNTAAVLPLIGNGSFYYITYCGFTINCLNAQSTGTPLGVQFTLRFRDDTNDDTIIRVRPSIFSTVGAGTFTAIANVYLPVQHNMNLRLTADHAFGLILDSVTNLPSFLGTLSSTRITGSFFVAYTNNTN